MQLVASNQTIEVPEGTQINYYQNNPLLLAAKWVEQVNLASETENYLGDQLQYLFPIESMELWGPSGGDHGVLDPRFQDNKMDFQKQNLNVLRIGDSRLVRGWRPSTDGRGHFCAFRMREVLTPGLRRRPVGNWGRV